MKTLSSIKGLGPKTLLYLKNINITSINDLVNYYPYRHDLIVLDDIKTAEDKQNVIIECIVDSIPLTRRFRANMTSLTFRAMSNKKMIAVMIFNRAFLKNNLYPGRVITVFGKYDALKNTVIASDIKFEKLESGSIESVYHLTSGLTSKQLKKYIYEALDDYDDYVDYIPEYLNERYKLISKKEAVLQIHRPQSQELLKKAKIKLKYEELFEFMFKINYLKELKKESKVGYLKNVDTNDVNDFIRSLPFELTPDQDTAIEDIYKDMVSSKRMNRMLQGDVGSGKTIVSIVAAYINYLAKYQTALMAPTEVLAYQHYETIKNILASTNVRIDLLVGSMKKKDKDVVIEKLKEGKIDFLIGTHALLSNNVEFKNLGLVITDEQHRFGVNQRANLKNKGLLPDILYMSATPIPRTFALTIYGDMDISNIKTKPKGRKEIKTIIKSEKDLLSVYELMSKEIEKNHQIYVVSPLIEESDVLDLTTVNDLKTNIDLYFKNNIKSSIMHGKLSKQDKDKIMEDFKNGKTNILISTTIIEVGIDVKNATMIVIFDAKRFGLATLHQLRGRVGRNEFDSTCILIGSSLNKRLKVLEESNDGFYITECDYEMRGEGDLFGVKQSGDMDFKIANLRTDMKILLQTRDDSREFLNDNIEDDFKHYKEYAKIVRELTNLN
ncbi:MAG: ATP-dependent DNA helicase RecG [Tenericutes bacterium]|nr:ATP-dependent DNA helicase RecG [Mycoplasmatota bacterium]